MEAELCENFHSFFNFSLELIEKLDKKNNYLKFAVVNMQIALELFLKYYFVRKGQASSIIAENKNGAVRYKEFSDVLNFFFSVNRDTYGKKKELRKILETRNSIVHNGLNGGWNKELALYLIKCIYFIQGTLKYEFDESLFEPTCNEINLSHNTIWRSGVQEFVQSLSNKESFPILECPFCYTDSLVHNEIFGFDDLSLTENRLQCLCCFMYIDIENTFDLIECNECFQKSYIVDKLNRQDDNSYYGKCISPGCGYKGFVNKCAVCDEFYHIGLDDLKREGKYYCSQECYTFDSK